MKKEFKVIADLLPNNSRVLDIGCGDGSLMNFLVKEKNIETRGLELDQNNVQECLNKGLTVIQGNAETELYQFPNQSFDYVVLSQTLQAFYKPDKVLNELLRIGRHAIVSFPNFGYWRVLYDLLVKGRSPISEKLPYIWCDSPNIRFCTMTDFVTLAEDMGFVIDRVVSIDHSGRATSRLSVGRWTNWFAEEAIYLLSRQNQ